MSGEGEEAQALSLARALLSRLLALEEGPMRARAAARALAAGDPELTALALAALCKSGGTFERVALSAVGQAFLDKELGLTYETMAELYAAAVARGLTEVTSLFLSPAPHKTYVPPRDHSDSRLSHLSLGHKKVAARVQRDPDLLARLAAEGTPEVVRELLQNPQLTEPFAIRIAARRPCRPQTLRLLAEAPRWRTRPAVALAIARNPYAEPAVSLKLLGFLARTDSKDLGKDGAIHPLVRALAAKLSEGQGGKAS